MGVRWGRVCGIFQHGASCIQWVNADSDLVPVLSLEPLHQSLRAHRGQLLPAWGPKTPKSCPVKYAVWTHISSLPVARKPLIDSAQVGWDGVPESHQGGLNRAHLANENPDLTMLGEDSTQG